MTWLGVLIYGGTAGGLLFDKFTRDEEAEADIAGVQITFDAGYDPRGFERYITNSNIKYAKNNTPSPIFRRHPYSLDRVENIEFEIAKMGGAPDVYQIDSPDFRELKRIQSIPLARRVSSRPVTIEE
jgi:predicted Zn-dependent protease